MTRCANCQKLLMGWSHQVLAGMVVLCARCKEERDKTVPHVLVASRFTCSCGSQFASIEALTRHAEESKP